eukprot:294909-Pyramimonas_sp.AAC.1
MQGPYAPHRYRPPCLHTFTDLTGVGVPLPPTQRPVTRPSVLKISGLNVLDGSTIGASWTPQ